MLICCDNMDEEDCGQTDLEEISGEHKPVMEVIMENYGVDG